MKVAIGSDHAGFEYKEMIKEYLKKEFGFEVIDKGTYSNERTDYPLYAKAVAEAVAKGEADKGILICGTGIGMSITANKIKGIRAALCPNNFMAEMARKHNDANVLCLGQRVIGTDHALSIVKTFFTTEFEGGRHSDRLALITDIEGIN
jgi:ribose 5-phosphate isomerase B